ncbi:hypothetical protein PuT2_13575 [Pusillimonas sp. T2]|nr:hypothetical protein PuT2_13575 [Pusillimonas sp. T2]
MEAVAPICSSSRGSGMSKVAKSSTRRKWLQSVATLALCVAMPAAQAQAQATAPLKIGVLGSFTGGAADINKGELDGLKLKLKQIGYQIGDRQVELIVEDDGGDPGAGVTKMQKLVERDKVDMVVGPFLGHVVAATQEYVGKSGIPQLAMVGQIPENAKHPNSFVPGWNAVQLGRQMGQYAVNKLGYKTAVVISSKFAYGERVSEGFIDGFQKAGGKIEREVYVPLGTADWGPFITGAPKADSVFAATLGADAIKLVKARHEYGQRDRLPLIGVISTVDGMLLPAMGSAAYGAVAVTHYLPELDIPENRQFIEDFKKEYGKTPIGYYEALGYTIGQIIESAVTSSAGKTDPASLVAGLNKVDLKTPQGNFRFDPQTRFPYMDYYFVKVVDKAGKPNFEIIDVNRDVKPENN